MTGLFVLNALFLAAGAGLLAALRPFGTWGDVFRLLGVAYLAGVAAVTLVATEFVVAGHAPGVALTTAIALAIAVVGVAVGRTRGIRMPRRIFAPSREPLLAVAVVALALVLVLLENVFRVARLQGEVGGDSTAIWTPRGEMLYFFGGLDAKLWDLIGGQTYPILVPTLQSLDFHFIGSADTITLHVQYWLLLVGFVFAVAGLLRPRVPVVLLWPALLLLVVMPNFDYYALIPQADLPLQYFFVCAALCAWRWVEERSTWLLGCFALFAAASMATKREGQLLAACLFVAVLAVTWRARRYAWPRVLAVALAAFLVNLPWRLWFSRHDFTGESPGATLSQLVDHVDRIPPSVWLVLRLTFGWHDWLIAAPLGVAAAVVAALAGQARLAAFFGVLCALIVAGFTWILWSIDSLPIEPTDVTPMPRAVGALVLLALAFAPLLLAPLVRTERR
jgi:hypothetical protein